MTLCESCNHEHIEDEVDGNCMESDCNCEVDGRRLSGCECTKCKILVTWREAISAEGIKYLCDKCYNGEDREHPCRVCGKKALYEYQTRCENCNHTIRMNINNEMLNVSDELRVKDIILIMKKFCKFTHGIYKLRITNYGNTVLLDDNAVLKDLDLPDYNTYTLSDEVA